MLTLNGAHAYVEFDTVRRGATPIAGSFAVGDLIPCDVPKIEQMEMRP